MIIEKIKDYTVIDLDDIKKQLNFDLDYYDEDDYLDKLKQVAVDYCESYLGLDIVPTDNTLTIDDFKGDKLKVDAGILQEITSIKLNGEEITDFSTKIKYYSFIIEFKEQKEGQLDIAFKTGSDKIRPKYKQAILVKTSDLYDSERQSYNYNLKKNEIIKYLLIL